MKKLSSTNFENQQILHEFCDAAYTLSLISGRWKLTILTNLQKGINRFSTLKAAIPSITERVLALQLKELEKASLIIKKELSEPERLLIYTLSSSGLNLIPLIESLGEWGKANKQIT